jgi:AraC family transcriptional regulator, carnitine catabolism transcriptional activator
LVTSGTEERNVRKVAVLLLPEFSNFSLGALTEPLFIANWLAQATLFEWRTASLDGRPVRASDGSSVTVQGDLASARNCATVFVLASFDPAITTRNPLLLTVLKHQARKGTELIGIENGSLALAAAGLLNEHSAAIHWDNLAGFQELFPRLRTATGLYSFSKQRATCAGGSAILHMMIAWMAQHADSRIAALVSRHLLLAPELLQGQSDQAPNANIARARALMRTHVDDPLSCAALAGRLGLSLRQLERQFKQVLRHTVHTEYRFVRVERAHQYLQQTDMPVAEVAALTGFSSVEYFSKVYRHIFGVLPSTDRRQSTDAPVFRAGS